MKHQNLLIKKHKFFIQVEKWFGNPLDWNLAEKSLLVNGAAMSYVIVVLAWIYAVENWLGESSLFNLANIKQFKIVELIFLFLLAILAIATFYLKDKHPNSKLLTSLNIQLFVVSTLVLGFYVGYMNIFTGILLIGAPITGLILFETKIVLKGMGVSLTFILLSLFGSSLGLLQYAPVLQQEPISNGDIDLFWLCSQIYFTLPFSILLITLVIMLVQRWHERESEIHHLSCVDPLTKVWNRRQLTSELEKVQSESERHKHNFALLLLDLDHFKRINDQFGHVVGDEALSHAANLIQKTVRKSDVVGRYGGEEFCIILPNTQKKEAMEVSERCRGAIQFHQMKTKNGNVPLTASIGMVYVDEPLRHLKIEQLLEKADKALYLSKKKGRNMTSLWSTDINTITRLHPQSTNLQSS